MSFLRTFVLVLLALLLPVRGLMAATMPCVDGQPMSHVAAMAGDASAHGAGGSHLHHAATAGDASQPPCHDEPSSDNTDTGTPSACHACASGCCMASILGTPVVMPAPVPLASPEFPALSPRVAAVHPRGLDRPPRTA